MVKKFVDKRTKRFFDTPEELGIDPNQVVKANGWKGRINVINPEKSDIAKKINVTKKGEYALKVR